VVCAVVRATLDNDSCLVARSAFISSLANAYSISTLTMARACLAQIVRRACLGGTGSTFVTSETLACSILGASSVVVALSRALL